ncbi:Hamartin protein-domain-containing protein [Cytidiella melzeri]|nr:Hamartin protein-domain-containing protein [Cytidiella melzeri]
MAASDISRQLRLLLTDSTEAPSLPPFLEAVDTLVADCCVSQDSASVLAQLEEDLQTIYDEVIDHSVSLQIRIFLSVLYHLRPILPPVSLISTWFDLVLRPALREPKLPVDAVTHAKELIVSALNPAKQQRKEKVREFRRRLMDLYLLDAYNESSGDDVLEWAELDDAQKERKACWKANLEDVLVRVGLQQPQDLLTELYHCFASSGSRLQLFILINAYTSHADFPTHAAVLAAHPLLQSIINCLTLDNSSTECTVGITVLTKILPIFAVNACEDLKRLLPSLLLVLGRLVCWETRQPESSLPAFTLLRGRSHETNVLIEPTIDDPGDAVSGDSSAHLPIRPEVEWERLEQTFTGATSAPPMQRYFAFLYYLFPCNTVRFLRAPAFYLNTSGLESPYTMSWEDALDEDKIRSKSERLLRGHVLHPLLIWRDASEELTSPDAWAQYDIHRIVAECAMLDIRSASVGLREKLLQDTSVGVAPEIAGNPEPASPITPANLSTSVDSSESSVVPMVHSPPSRIQISLQDMISTSIALKSGLDLEILDTPSATEFWTTTLAEHSARTRSPSRKSIASASVRSPSPDLPTIRESSAQDVPSHVTAALAGLQRDVLMLRCELNFELWMARNNVRHIGRLYQDRVLSRFAEVERQGLHNKLREYKGEIYRLQKGLKDHKEQALAVRNEYANWNKKLQDKIKDFRQEKSSWQTEATEMRAANKEIQASFAAQSKLLSEANHKVFMLETKIKESAHKVDRLYDYERQIEQLVALQRLWETDVQKLNDQTEVLKACESSYKKMEQRLETLEYAHVVLMGHDRQQRHEIASLEARLSIAQKQLAVSRKSAPRSDLAPYRGEMQRLAGINHQLRESNSELREEMVEVKAMVELLKAQISGRQGVVADPRSSPFIAPTLNI